MCSECPRPSHHLPGFTALSSKGEPGTVLLGIMPYGPFDLLLGIRSHLMALRDGSPGTVLRFQS